MNPRDKHGWRIPREGTKSWFIYQLLLLDYTGQEICRLYQEHEQKSSIKVLVHNIKRPASHNSRSNIFYKANSEKINQKMANKKGKRNYSSYVTKLVKILGITYTEAVVIEKEQLEKEQAK